MYRTARAFHIHSIMWDHRQHTVLTMILLCTYITTFFSLSTFSVAFRMHAGHIFAVTSACMILLYFPEKHILLKR